MLHDWYADYCRLIAPRSPTEDLAHHEQTLPDVTGTQQFLERFSMQFQGTRRTAPLRFMTLLEVMGALHTRLRQATLSPDDVRVGREVLARFEALLQREAPRLSPLVQREVEAALREHLTVWQRLVTECLQEKGAEETQFYWDLRTQTLFAHDGTVEEFASFVARIRNDPHIVLAVDYWEYVLDLPARTLLAQLLQFASRYYDITPFQQAMHQADQQLLPTLVPYDHLLAEGDKPYFPATYFWWYYHVPCGVVLYEGERTIYFPCPKENRA